MMRFHIFILLMATTISTCYGQLLKSERINPKEHSMSGLSNWEEMHIKYCNGVSRSFSGPNTLVLENNICQIQVMKSIPNYSKSFPHANYFYSQFGYLDSLYTDFSIFMITEDSLEVNIDEKEFFIYQDSTNIPVARKVFKKTVFKHHRDMADYTRYVSNISLEHWESGKTKKCTIVMNATSQYGPICSEVLLFSEIGLIQSIELSCNNDLIHFLEFKYLRCEE